MLTTDDLAGDLDQLAEQARALARQVRGNGDLPPRQLAGALVESAKIGDKLTRLAKQLHGGDGRKRK